MTRHISDEASRTCPKCGKMMDPQVAGDVAFQRCTGCAGLWLETAAMERLIDDKAASLAIDTGDAALGDWTADIEGVLQCPRDGARLIRMVNHHQPHVHFESCKVCGGVFLDAGELRDLASYSIIERLRSLLRRAG